MKQQIDVFVSSTSRDLTGHRAAVRSVIEGLGLNLIMMEDFPAEDAKAVAACKRYVDEAEIYVGIYAHRYGWIPSIDDGGDGISSITALEYEWAKRRGIPRLCFSIDPAYEWPDDYREVGRGAELLNTFKSRVDSEVIRAIYNSPESLASQVRSAVSKALGWRPSAPPSPVRRYVGRDDFLANMRNALDTPNRVALTGIGGIGKTMTAAQIAQDMGKTFSGGVLWVSFGTETREPEPLLGDTMRRWAGYHHPGRIMNPDDLRPEQIRYWLSEIAQTKPLLIVFDDIWHIRPARELLRLVPNNATFLITTRRADIARQLDIRTTQMHEIDRLSEIDSIALLRDRVGDLPSPDALRQIVDLLDGHPLALDIIGAQINQSGPDYADDLPNILSERLASGEGLGLLHTEGDKARYANVEVTLALTYESMSRDLKRRFRVLGVLVPDAPIPQHILSALWKDDIEDKTGCNDSKNRMDALVSAGVLSRIGALYSQHGLLRVYAHALLRQTGEETVIRECYTKYIVTERASQFSQLVPEQWNALLAPDYPHIHYVGDLLVEEVSNWLGATTLTTIAGPELTFDVPKAAEEATEVLETGENYAFEVAGYISQRRELGQAGLRWLQMGLACARLQAHQTREKTFLNNLAIWYHHRGQPMIALSYYQSRLPLDRQLGDQVGESITLNNIGQVYQAVGQTEQALSFFEQALSIQYDIGNRIGEPTVLNNIATLYQATGQPERALEIHEKVLPMYRAIGDRTGEATSLNNIAGVYQSIGRRDKAIQFYEETLAIRREIGDRAKEANTLAGIATVYANSGQRDKALQFYEEILAIRREVGDRSGEASTITGMASIYASIGQTKRALELFENALPIRREVGDRSGEADTLYNMASAYQSIAQFGKSLELFEQALPISRDVGNRHIEASILAGIGNVYRQTGQTERAVIFYQQAILIQHEIGDRAEETTTLNNLAGINLDAGRLSEALEIYQNVLAIVREIGDRPKEANALNSIGLIYQYAKSPEQALTLYRQALPIMGEVGDRVGEANTLNNMAGIYFDIGQPEQALKYYQQAVLIQRETGDRVGEANTLSNIGYIFLEQGQAARTVDMLRQALQIDREIGTVDREALHSYNLAQVLTTNFGQFDEALNLVRRALTIMEQHNMQHVHGDLSIDEVRLFMSDLSGF